MKDLDVRLSYSSASTLQLCSQKYYWYKIKQVPKDTDCEDDSTAFNIGKVFHFVLEKTKHERTDDMGQILKHACAEFKLDEGEQAMIHAMILRYLEVHKLSGLKCIKTEFEMSSQDFIGYIDALLTDVNGDWWICDLKTAATFSEITAAQLHNDTQLNLYSFFATEMAVLFNLESAKFKGCRYRVTTKSRIKKKETEEYAKFVTRCYDSIKSYDVIVPIELMCPEKAMARHLRVFAESIKLRNGEITPFQNFQACSNYFRPCEYWSQCHGSTFTECKNKLKILKTDE